MELGGRGVLVGAQVLLNGRQVHRLLHDLGVVRNAQRDRIHGLSEGPGSLAVFEKGEDSDAGAETFADVLVRVAASDLLLRVVLLVDCVFDLFGVATVVIFGGTC